MPTCKAACGKRIWIAVGPGSLLLAGPLLVDGGRSKNYVLHEGGDSATLRLSSSPSAPDRHEAPEAALPFAPGLGEAGGILSHAHAPTSSYGRAHPSLRMGYVL